MDRAGRRISHRMKPAGMDSNDQGTAKASSHAAQRELSSRDAAEAATTLLGLSQPSIMPEGSSCRPKIYCRQVATRFCSVSHNCPTDNTHAVEAQWRMEGKDCSASSHAAHKSSLVNPAKCARLSGEAPLRFSMMKQVVFCGWDGQRLGVRSSLTAFRQHMYQVGKCARLVVDGFLSCLEVGGRSFVSTSLNKTWQLKPPEAHPQVELKVSDSGLYLSSEDWSGCWDRITRIVAVLSKLPNGSTSLAEVRLEGSFCEVVYALWAHRPSRTESEQVANLLTANNIHQVLTQISHALHYVDRAFDAEYRMMSKSIHSLEVHASLKPGSMDPLTPSHKLAAHCRYGEIETAPSFCHTQFTKAYDREKLILFLKEFDENDALPAYPAEMPLVAIPNGGDIKIPGHVVLRGKPEGVRGPKTGTARWGADGKNGFLIVGAEAAAKQNKELEERYDKGIYPVAIFLITNPAFYEFDNRFHGFPAEVWTDSGWAINEQPAHSNITELVSPTGESYQPPPGWRWIEIRQKKEDSKRLKRMYGNVRRTHTLPSRIVLMNMKKVLIDFKQEVKNGVLDLGTKRCTMNVAEDVDAPLIER